MTNSWKIFGAVLAYLLAADFIWLGVLARKFFLEQFAPIGRIENGKFDIVLWPAVLAYLLMAAAVLYFSLPRVPAGAPWWQAAVAGGLLGLTLFGVYDFTNHATLRHWPVQLMLVDISWGTFLMAGATILAKLLRDA